VDNPVKDARKKLMLSKSELARKAGISLLTVDRLEKGKACRIRTKRKILKALGFNPWLKKETAPGTKRYGTQR
jgi:DNA-binding XRE family transcriptional regulator